MPRKFAASCVVRDWSTGATVMALPARIACATSTSTLKASRGKGTVWPSGPNSAAGAVMWSRNLDKSSIGSRSCGGSTVLRSPNCVFM